MSSLQVIDTLFSMESPSSVIHLSKCGDTAAHCVAAMDDAGISKVVLAPCKRLECERHWVCGDIQTDEVQRCVASRPDRFAGLAAYNPHAINESMQQIDVAVRQWDLRGVYVPWDVSDVKLQDACMYPLYERCVELNVPVMVAFGDVAEGALKMPAAIHAIMGDFPELRMILAWPTAADLNMMLAACKQHPTVSIAFDGRVAAGQESALRDWLKAEGQYRCMWGSNGLPWKKLLEQVYSYSLPDNVLNSFLHENASRSFGLAHVTMPAKSSENDPIVVAD